MLPSRLYRALKTSSDQLAYQAWLITFPLDVFANLGRCREKSLRLMYKTHNPISFLSTGLLCGSATIVHGIYFLEVAKLSIRKCTYIQ